MTRFFDLWRTIEALLFPPPSFQGRQLSWKQYTLFVPAGVVVFGLIGSFLPATGIVGYDWVYYFGTGQRSLGLSYYPPWIVYVKYLTWPGLIGCTLTGLALALYQRKAAPAALAAAFFTFPVLWVLFLGQVDGLVGLGLTGMPWLMPLVTLKPHVGYLACLARKEYLAGLLLWLLISLAIWGLWPRDMLNIWQFSGIGQPHDITLWPWSILVVLGLLWLSRGDVDMLMLAGVFLLPYLHPYHYFLVVPALARTCLRVALLAVAVSWLPVLSNWWGPWLWFTGHLFPAMLWLELYRLRRAAASAAIPAH